MTPADLEATRGPTGSAEGSLDRIWNRLRRPVDPHGAIAALAGVPRRTARQVVGAAIAGSREADELLAVMPHLIRNLSISTVSVPERCLGQIRGPVLWSETMSARASSAGDPGIYVCATVSRDHDTPVNRLLVSALGAVVRGGRDVERFYPEEGEPEPTILLDARANADAAERYLDHRTLIDVPRIPPARREMRRVRYDKRQRAYRPVGAMLGRALEPLEVSTIRLFCDETTTARHDLLVAAIDHFESRGVPIPDLLVVDNALVGGPIEFHHPSLATRAGTGRTGLFIASERIDVPGGIPEDAGVRVVSNRGELGMIIDEVIMAGDV